MISRRHFGKLVGGVAGSSLLLPLIGKASVALAKPQTKIHYVFLSEGVLPRWALDQGQQCLVLVGNPWMSFGVFSKQTDTLRKILNVNLDGDILPSEKDIIPGTTISSCIISSSSGCGELLVPMFPNLRNSPQHNEQIALYAQSAFKNAFGYEAKDIIVATRAIVKNLDPYHFTHSIGVVAFG